jgi:hypothetical protein
VSPAAAALRIALAALYVGANVPFAFKYASRAGADGAIAAWVYAALALALWWGAPAVARATSRRDRRGRLYAGLAVAAAAALAVMMLRFDPGAIRVTRAPAIEQWLDRLLAGEFPYADDARPSSFPVWFLIALPFRLAGDVGWMQIAAFLAFAALCRRLAGLDPARAWTAMALLAASPLFLFEVATRSDLFANTTFVIAILLALEPDPSRPAARWLAPVAAGIALSTRGIFALALAVLLPWRHRSRPAAGVAPAAIVAATFAATLVPFLLWDAGRFLGDGPLAIQLSYAPRWLVAALGVAGVALGATAPTARRAWLAVALLLYAAIACVFVYSVAAEGWRTVLLGDTFDISYFAFGQTALLAWLAQYEIGPDRGRSGP